VTRISKPEKEPFFSFVTNPGVPFARAHLSNAGTIVVFRLTITTLLDFGLDARIYQMAADDGY
jgi:hypothetical protein